MIRHTEVIAIVTQQASTEPLEEVVARLADDRAFRVKYCQDPDRALEAYLSPEQIKAVKTGDGHLLQKLGGGSHWDALISTLCGPDPGP